MDCTHCDLQSRLRSSHTSTTSTLQTSSSDENADRTSKRLISIMNTNAQVSIACHRERDSALTAGHQLSITSHNFHRHMDNIQLATSRRHLIAFSSHELPPALCNFAGLWSTPFNLYRLYHSKNCTSSTSTKLVISVTLLMGCYKKLPAYLCPRS